jgi:ABC-type Fe3+ transport system permease subunit
MILALLLKRKVKKMILSKLRSSAKSATIGVSSLAVVSGLVVQYSDQLGPFLASLVPEQYGGLTLAVFGVVVALARLRTLGAPAPSAEDQKQ